MFASQYAIQLLPAVTMQVPEDRWAPDKQAMPLFLTRGGEIRGQGSSASPGAQVRHIDYPSLSGIAKKFNIPWAVSRFSRLCEGVGVGW